MPRAVALGLALITLAVAALAILGVLGVVTFDAVRTATGRVVAVIVIVVVAATVIGALLGRRPKPER